MQSTQRKTRGQRRVTKAGCFYLGLQISGWFLIGFGMLTLLFGVWQFASLAWSQGADLSYALSHLRQQGAQFLLTLYGVWFVVFAAIGCAGLAMLGIGFGLDRAATTPIIPPRQQPIDKPLSPA